MSITQILKGDSTGAVKAVQDFNKALDQTEEQAKLSVKEMKNLDQQAKRIVENVNPQEKYNRKMAELAQHVKSGRIAMSDAQLAAAKYERELRGVGNSGDKAFGPKMLGQIASLGGGILSVTALVGGLKAAFQEAERAAQASADSAFASLGAQGELQQLTDDPKKLAEVNNFAKELIRRGIFSPSERAQAFETSFELESAGYSAADKEKFAQVGEGGLVKPSGIVNLGGFVRKAQRTFGLGEDTTAEVLDKLIQTSASAQAGLVDTAKAVPEFGSNAKALGLTLDESLAGFLAVEKRSPGPDEAATRFKNALAKMEEMQLPVQGDLTEMLDLLSKRVGQGEKDFEMFTESRALKGFRNLILGQGEIAVSESQLRDSAGLAERRSGQLEDLDPLFGAGKLRQRAEGRLADTQEKLTAEKELLFDVLQAASAEKDLRDGLDVVERYSRQKGLEFADAFELENVRLKNEIAQFRSDPASSPLNQEQADRIIDYLKRTAEGIDTIKKKKTPPQGRQE